MNEHYHLLFDLNGCHWLMNKKKEEGVDYNK